MIFLLGEESQVSLEQFEILRGVSRKTPRFQFTYNYFVYYSYAKTLSQNTLLCQNICNYNSTQCLQK